MKQTLKLLLITFITYVGSANAFFFVIPTGAISDLVTGAEGKHCVSNETKIGDKLPQPNGQVFEIKSLSGTSSRCTQPINPIRALMEPVEIPPVETSLIIQAPDGYVESKLTNVNKFNRVVKLFIQKDTGTGFQVLSTPKHTVSDIISYAEKRRGFLIATVIDGKGDQIKPLLINNIPALQYEISGSFKDGSNAKYLNTILDGQDEIIQVIQWTKIDNYDSKKDLFQSLLNNIQGITAPAKSEIIFEGSLEYNKQKCNQLGLTDGTKKFDECLVMLSK